MPPTIPPSAVQVVRHHAGLPDGKQTALPIAVGDHLVFTTDSGDMIDHDHAGLVELGVQLPRAGSGVLPDPVAAPLPAPAFSVAQIAAVDAQPLLANPVGDGMIGNNEKGISAPAGPAAPLTSDPRLHSQSLTDANRRVAAGTSTAPAPIPTANQRLLPLPGTGAPATAPVPAPGAATNSEAGAPKAPRGPEHPNLVAEHVPAPPEKSGERQQFPDSAKVASATASEHEITQRFTRARATPSNSGGSQQTLVSSTRPSIDPPTSAPVAAEPVGIKATHPSSRTGEQPAVPSGIPETGALHVRDHPRPADAILPVPAPEGPKPTAEHLPRPAATPPDPAVPPQPTPEAKSPEVPAKASPEPAHKPEQPTLTVQHKAGARIPQTAAFGQDESGEGPGMGSFMRKPPPGADPEQPTLPVTRAIAQQRGQPAAAEVSGAPEIRTAAIDAGPIQVQPELGEEPAIGGIVNGPSSTASVGASQQQAIPAWDAGPRLAAQVTEAARGLVNGPVELSLAPEELGKVRLTLHATDTGMSVSIAVERPETLDLFRRNIGLLAQQLREAGYHSVSFGFSDHRNSEHTAQQFAPPNGSEAPFPAAPDMPGGPILPAPSVNHSAQVDMRV